MPRQRLYDREQSLDKAVNLFWQQGFHATSLKDLEQALDMRPGSIYAAFGSKQALFEAALDRYAALGLEDLEKQRARYASPIDGLAAYVRALGALREPAVPSRACLLVKSLLELGDRASLAGNKADHWLAAMEQQFVEAFRTAQARGELGPEQDPTRLGRRLQAEVMGLRSYAQRAVASSAVQQLADDIADSIVAYRRQPN